MSLSDDTGTAGDFITGFSWLNTSTAARLGQTGGTYSFQATEQRHQLIVDIDISTTDLA